MSSNSQRFPIGQTLRPLVGLNDVIFLHAMLAEHQGVSKVATTEQVGAIYTPPTYKGTIRTDRHTISSAVKNHRANTGGDGDILLDAGVYSGRSRKPGTQSVDPVWAKFQRTIGLPMALTDSGYIGEGDALALDTTLRSGAACGDRTLTILPLANAWLGIEADRLRSEIERYGGPVGLVLEHLGDPLGVRRNVKGLMHLLESDVSVSLLRSDMSVVGAISAGATFGAVGTSSGRRHLYPRREKDTGGYIPGPPSVLIRRALKWVRLDKLELAVSQTPTDLHWICDCSYCGGRRLSWILNETDAYMHNLACVAEVARHVMGFTSTDRLAVWARMCDDAQFVNFDIEAATGNWDIPNYLGAWMSAAHVSAVGQPL